MAGAGELAGYRGIVAVQPVLQAGQQAVQPSGEVTVKAGVHGASLPGMLKGRPGADTSVTRPPGRRRCC